ncbi:putative aminotriazole resistance protein [Aspergillus flavus]|uniref:Aminotriazole resistance protein n=1 Tax=Aspergillus flavus (strain ATCC 200026 / FGSC A1120 / IAM 13836 / NRRL 3357 / JCM 12722 / SRRC 167) TaxID=332952 RepID=A0A7U2MG86_ASPFN|nr:putative aminotriazole resistance protein [Aspergillus flavus]
MSQTAVLTQTAASPPDVHDSPHFLVQSQLDHDSRRGPGSQSSLSREYGSSEDIDDDQRTNLSRTRAVILITILTGITHLPSSVYSLANGCCLLLAGSLADFMGNRMINLIGCFLLGTFTLACGVAQNGIQLILFRTFQGIATSMCLPTAFSILTDSMPVGKRRNIGFACLGLGQPFGFSVGLVFGGLFQETSLKWRFGYYLCAGVTMGLAVVNFFKLPKDSAREPFTFGRLRREIDWMGIFLSSSSLGMILMCLRWMNWREKIGKPALIPNSLWQNTAFSSICIMVLFSWAVLNGMETILSLFFQEVQDLPAIQAALRFLPSIISGITLNLGTGLLVHRLHANYLVLVASVLSAGSPLLMAIIDPEWSWWYCAFWAMLLGPLSADVIFTVANLIITEAFTPKTQGLAGAVFNVVAQFGTSIGLTIFAIISAGVTQGSLYENKKSPEALMLGYRAVFWTCFGLMMAVCCFGAWGLRKVGKVGLKRE